MSDLPPQPSTASPGQEQPRRTDHQIWGIYIVLCIISIIELYSASSHEVTATNIFGPILRHVMFLLVGLCIMLALQRTHYKYFLKWIWPFAIFSALLMVITLFFGDYVNGARRSISFGPITIQPAEMVKISVVLVIASVLSRSQMKGETDVTNSGLIKVCVACAVACILLVSQGLTNTLLLMAIAMSMMLIGGISAKKFFIIMGIFAICGGIFVGYKMIKSSVKKDEKQEVVYTPIEGTDVQAVIGSSTATAGRGGTWKARVQRYFNKEKYNEPITDINQQEQYSYIAQAHGGVFGVMPGNSRETARLPLAFSDYIYAIIIEELGLVGGIVVLVLYLWLLARAGRVAYRCQTAFPALLVMGMAVFITFQAVFHMCIVTGVFPVSGQPLPLISKGGTSILITSMALGIMLSVSRFAARKGKKAEIKEELQELPGEVSAENPS